MSRLYKMSSFKPNNFHLSLIDYLIDELRSNKIKCKKQTARITIPLEAAVDDKYSHMVIDCFNGNVYLRGDNQRDKKILKLVRFDGGCRESDAMHCAKGGVKQIIRCLERLQQPSKQLEVEAELNNVSFVDCRTFIKDMRKTFANIVDKRKRVYNDMRTACLNKIKNFIDLRGAKLAMTNRDFAIAIVNGEIFEGDTHGEAISKYLQSIGVEDIFVYDRDELDQILGKGIKNQFAAAHVQDDTIYIEPDTLENISMDQVTYLLHSQYPGYHIVDIDSKERLASVKLSWHDIGDRDCAIAFIDGEIVEGETHALCIDKYLQEHQQGSLNEKQIRPNINIEVDDAWDDSQSQDLQNIYDNINQIVFGHVDKTNKIIYLEPEGLNVTVSDISNIAPKIKQNYSDYKIVIDNASNTNFQQVANMSRLKKISDHDAINRDCAILYINGEFIEAHTHVQALSEYAVKMGYEPLTEDTTRPHLDDASNPNFKTTDRHKIEDIKEIIKEVAFAHKVNSENAVYVEEYSLIGIDIYTAAELFKDHYPSYEIYNDDTYNHNEDTYELIAKVATFHDKNNRTSAILYIDGDIMEGPDHWEMIKDYYLQNYNINANNEENIKQIENLYDDSPRATASKVDEEKIIYLDEASVLNIDEKTVINALNNKFPGFNTVVEEYDLDALTEYTNQYGDQEFLNKYK